MNENNSSLLDGARIIGGTLFRPRPVSMHTDERVSSVQLPRLEGDSRLI